MSRQTETQHALVGRWHIVSMEMWEDPYLNMEVQAFIEIRPDRMGEFQFGLVAGFMQGEIEKEGRGRERFVFTWDGQDEMDPASGSGWLRLTNESEAHGVIRLHMGDRSTFEARRAPESAAAGNPAA